MHHLRRTRITLTIGLVAAIALAACGGDEDTGAADTTGADAGTADAGTTDGGATGDVAAGDCGVIDIGWIPWDEDIAVTNLWDHVLTEHGYEVEQTQLEVGAIYAGLADGDLDLFLDAWLPATHADYWEQFGERVADLGTWFDQAPLTWAVPTYVAEEQGITSLEDLQDNAELFDGQVIGIEPGAGLTRISKEAVIPSYELGDQYELVEGSTPAMLAALGEAVEAQEPIVVTLWEPHFAYGQWDLTNLEDPQNALGDPEEIHSLSRTGFAEDCPQVAAWIEGFTISNEDLAALEVAINDAGDPAAGVEQWVGENRDYVDQLTAS